jgi:hypothetical protein
VPEKELEEFLEENKMKYVTVLVQTLLKGRARA